MNPDDFVISLAHPAGSEPPSPGALTHNRQSGESARAHQAFARYCGMGPERSLAKLGQTLGKSTGLLERWSSRWSWQARVRGWETEQEQVQREAGWKAAEAIAAERLAQRARRRAVVGKFMARAEELLDDRLGFRETPGPVAAAVARALRESREEFGCDPTGIETEDAALLPPTSAAPTLTLIVNGEVRRFEVPPPGEIEPETDGA